MRSTSYLDEHDSTNLITVDRFQLHRVLRGMTLAGAMAGGNGARTALGLAPLRRLDQHGRTRRPRMITDVFATYLEGGRGYLAGLVEWARLQGYEVRRKRGIVSIHCDGRLIAAAAPPWREVPGRERHPISGEPCPTCSAAPTSTYHDGSPKYACGPHPAFRVGPDGERIALP